MARQKDGNQITVVIVAPLSGKGDVEVRIAAGKLPRSGAGRIRFR
jgi:hypothetical protein